MTHIAIQDANLIIDLVKGGIFKEAVTKLDYKYIIPDVVVSEITSPIDAIEELNSLIKSGDIEVISFDPNEVSLIANLNSKYSPLSFEDSSCLYCGINKDALLLTGDRALRNASKIEGVSVKGSLGILDDLVNLNKISKKVAYNSLELIMKTNTRLPIKECSKRLKLWSP